MESIKKLMDEIDLKLKEVTYHLENRKSNAEESKKKPSYGTLLGWFENHPMNKKFEKEEPLEDWKRDIPVMDEKSQSKMYAGITGPIERWELESTHKQYPGAFMTVKGFTQYYPSFTEQFLRTRLKNKEFVSKAVRRIRSSVFIEVEGFWSWLRTCPRTNPKVSDIL